MTNYKEVYFFIYNFSKVNGGQEKYIEYLANEFKRHNINLSIIKQKPTLSAIFRPVNYPYKIKKKSLIIEILNGNSALYFRGPLIRNKNVKKIYIQHSSINDNQEGAFKKIIRFILFLVLLKNISKIIGVANSVLPNFFYNEKKFTIYNGVPSENLKFKKFIPKNFKKIDLLMVGSINKNKNQELAISLIRKNIKYNLTLLGDGELKDNLMNKNEDLIASGRLKFLGNIASTREYYLNLHVLLSLSSNEGMPFAILEAMSYGLPVVSTKVGGIPEIIRNNYNGILLKKNNLSSLEKCLDSLMNKKLYNQISFNARQTIKSKFTSTNMYNNLIRIINL
tara:strand:+ start:249 stop:1259 length:1011 start_codon:yes stop_codon:yes gene_type:complete